VQTKTPFGQSATLVEYCLFVAWYNIQRLQDNLPTNQLAVSQGSVKLRTG